MTPHPDPLASGEGACRAGEAAFWPIFLILLSFGAFLRFHALDRPSIWDDEMTTIETISVPLNQIIHRHKTYETHPPLYFLQERLWKRLGARSLVKLRANSALWGTLSLILLFILGRRYFGAWGGVLAMSYAAFSPFHLAYSQEMRPYAMAIVLGLLSLWALEEANEQPSPPAPLPTQGEGGRRPGEGGWKWYLLGFLWTLNLYTHYWGAFVVLAQAAHGFYAAPSRSHRKAVAAAFIGASLLFVPWLPVLWAQMQIVDALSFWVPPFSLANALKPFAAFAGLFFNMASNAFYLPLVFGSLILLGLAQTLALVRGIRRGPHVLGVWLMIGLGTPWLISLWKPGIYVWYRYTFLMYPAFVLLVTGGLLAWRPPWFRGFLMAVCLGTQLWGTYVYFTRFQKANPKDVVRYVHQLTRPNTVVVRPSYFARLYNFYDAGTTPAMDEDVFDRPDKRAALKGRNVILIAFDVPSDPVTEAFLSEYKVVSALHFRGFAHLGITVYQLQ